MSYGEADSHPSGFEQGNTGYSGAPMWKIKQQTQQYRAVVEAAQAARIEEEKKKHEEDAKAKQVVMAGPKILVDAVSVRNSKKQQLVRHVLVKDLRKAAQVMNMELPMQGIFDDKGGQRALLAIFDGQSAAVPAAMAAEVCCKHVLGKVLRNLLSLPANNCTATFVKAALLKTFEDLTQELQIGGVNERCGCALALVVGDWLFTAVLGGCGALVCQVPNESEAGRSSAYVVTSLSNQAGHAPHSTAPGQSLGTPDVKGTQLKMGGEPFFVLTGVPATSQVPATEQGEIAASFVRRPRAATGEIAARAAKRKEQSGDGEVDTIALAGYFKRGDDVNKPGGGEPKAKKAKKEVVDMDSVRLRHIVVRYKDDKHGGLNPVTQKPVTRSRDDAEATLREALAELLKDGDHTGDSTWAAKVTPRILNACRQYSECRTAQKGGSSCGDLGWLNKKELQRMGQGQFADLICGLGVAEWSDLLFSVEGVHLVMRMA